METQCNQLRSHLQLRDDDVSRLNRELSALSLARDSEVASLRADLKMKTFESTSLGATYEV